MFGLAPRAEIDDVHKSLTELRREVRALKRALMLFRSAVMVEASSLAIDPVRAFAEAKGFSERLAQGTKLFGEVKDEDVQIATTPKDEIWRQDKVTLYHYRPLTERKVLTPVLIAYGLVGRYTMVDLQEDRSLVRNLLNLGVDLYVVDWGNPNRADRYVTLKDYDTYLDECVNVIGAP
jgi:polyhydroxyalkanoate synthase